jgi:hypothetical protein
MPKYLSRNLSFDLCQALQGFSMALVLGGLIAMILAVGWRCSYKGMSVGVVLYSIGIVLMKGGHE